MKIAVAVVVSVALAVAILAAALPSIADNICIDRRDYAPGYNTYRLVYCDALPAYRSEGAGTTNWSGHDAGRPGQAR